MRATRLAVLLSTWFGCGYSPVAPGTAGSIAAWLAGIALVELAGWKPLAFAALAAAATPPAIWCSGLTARATQSKDPSYVVIDEVVGTWLTLAGATRFNWKSYAAAILLFRVFDIWKPPPVRRLERFPGGTGIVLDDLAAGLYAALVLFAAGCFNLY
jgi:phosphatidylglycerophosphatase A